MTPFCSIGRRPTSMHGGVRGIGPRNIYVGFSRLRCNRTPLVPSMERCSTSDCAATVIDSPLMATVGSEPGNRRLSTAVARGNCFNPRQRGSLTVRCCFAEPRFSRLASAVHPSALLAQDRDWDEVGGAFLNQPRVRKFCVSVGADGRRCVGRAEPVCIGVVQGCWGRPVLSQLRRTPAVRPSFCQ